MRRHERSGPVLAACDIIVIFSKMVDALKNSKLVCFLNL
jgi:hypothetical protein